jgi:hypothetical protein
MLQYACLDAVEHECTGTERVINDAMVSLNHPRAGIVRFAMAATKKGRTLSHSFAGPPLELLDSSRTPSVVLHFLAS